jgi:glycogen debranching enzyme
MLSNRASQIIKAITDKLWLDDFQYLMNYYEDKTFDPHYYIGSLLAVHYNVIDTLKQKKLIETAGKKMLDPKVGIYCAYPMDFAGLIDYLKFSGNEAGAPYYYLNGGIWPQGNAWYALALIAVNRHREAANFLRETMTIKGIMTSPRGQPAMYEVRNANRNNPDEYGICIHFIIYSAFMRMNGILECKFPLLNPAMKITIKPTFLARK